MKRHQSSISQVIVSENSKKLSVQIQARASSVLPGLMLCVGLAWLAFFLHQLPHLSVFSSMILAIALGISVRNTVGVARKYESGIRFTLRRILRIAVALLGLQLNLVQIATVGFSGLAIVVATLFSTFWFTCWFGKRLGIRQGLAQLIAAGTSICGASAVIATNSVIESSDEDVAYAVATVTLFGTISMLLYPLLSSLLHLTPQAFGIWCGTSIHEVAQVIAAAFQSDSTSGELATVAKLSRIGLLAPVMLLVGTIGSKGSQRGDRNLPSPPFPWFILGFVGLIGFNSLDLLSPFEKSVITTSNQFLLTIAIAAMGLETTLHKIFQVGIKPLYLAASAWLFISVSSLMLIVIFYQ